MHKMQTIATDVPVAWCVSQSVCQCSVLQKRLDGSSPAGGGETLGKTMNIVYDSIRPSSGYFSTYYSSISLQATAQQPRVSPAHASRRQNGGSRERQRVKLNLATQSGQSVSRRPLLIACLLRPLSVALRHFVATGDHAFLISDLPFGSCTWTTVSDYARLLSFSLSLSLSLRLTVDGS